MSGRNQSGLGTPFTAYPNGPLPPTHPISTVPLPPHILAIFQSISGESCGQGQRLQDPVLQTLTQTYLVVYFTNLRSSQVNHVDAQVWVTPGRHCIHSSWILKIGFCIVVRCVSSSGVRLRCVLWTWAFHVLKPGDEEASVPWIWCWRTRLQ